MKFSLKERQNRVCYNWGFQFALWCALLWGTCYQLLEILISKESFLNIDASIRNPYAVGTILAIILSAFIALFSVIWIALTSDINEIKKSFFSTKKLSRYFLIEAVVGGLAAWATYITAGLLNTLFAVVGVMFYPLLGTMLAQKWLHEKVVSKTRIGMLIILIGWGVFYFPAIVGGSWGNNALIGGILGIITGIGWGIEGTIASKVSDMIDSDTSVAVRFIYEMAIWIVFFFLYAIICPNNIIWIYMKLFFQDLYSMVMLAVIALCLTFNYFSWYRSFTLVGVTEGLVISNVSGFVTVLASMLLSISMPAWTDIAACLIMIFGIFWTYWYGISTTGVFRNVNLTPYTRKGKVPIAYDKKPLKAQILIFIATSGPVWDFEVANLFSEHLINPKSRYKYRNRIRTYMIEAYAAGLLTSVKDVIDETGHFQKGKLLSYYQITEYGYQQLQENYLIK